VFTLLEHYKGVLHTLSPKRCPVNTVPKTLLEHYKGVTFTCFSFISQLSRNSLLQLRM
jgi:hypothetical protein